MVGGSKFALIEINDVMFSFPPKDPSKNGTFFRVGLLRDGATSERMEIRERRVGVGERSLWAGIN